MKPQAGAVRIREASGQIRTEPSAMQSRLAKVAKMRPEAQPAALEGLTCGCGRAAQRVVRALPDSTTLVAACDLHRVRRHARRPRLIRLRRADRCRTCGGTIEAGTLAYWMPGVGAWDRPCAEALAAARYEAPADAPQVAPARPLSRP